MRSVRLRVLLMMLAVSLVTLGGVGLFSSRTATIDLTDIRMPPMRVDVAAATRSIESAYTRAGSWRGITGVLAGIESRAGARVLLVSPKGRVIAASDAPLAAANVTLAQDGTLRLDESDGGGTAGASAHEDVIELRSPSSVAKDAIGRTLALVYFLPAPGSAGSLPPLAVAGDINRSIWLAIVIAGIAAAAAAFVLSSYILRPIGALTAASRRLAGGDLRARVAAGGEDEIGELGRSFNAMADTLAKLAKLREEMVADVAHELRTPLTHIRGRIEAIQDGRMQPEPRVIDALHADALLLQRLVQDLQDLSLADAGALHLTREPLDLEASVRSEIAAMPAGHRPIDVRIARELPRVMADPVRLRQILNNLLANAVRHASDGGEVWVGARCIKDAVEITVHNDGPVLAPADLVAIFERFYRADRSRSRETGGAGLGLAIVKQLVQAHGGNVWAENTTPLGVSVLFTMPVAI
jgi:signal transduction histidine kinase